MEKETTYDNFSEKGTGKKRKCQTLTAIKFTHSLP